MRTIEDLYGVRCYSLDARMSAADGAGTFAELVADGGPSPELIASRKVDAAHALSVVSELERDVLLMRYRDGLTLKQIGDRLLVSREWARQIEAKALGVIRREFGVNG